MNSQSKREEQLKDAHDEAMFGAPTGHTFIGNNEDDVTETVQDIEGENNSGAAVSLVSEKVKTPSFHFLPVLTNSGSLELD